MAVFKCKMCGGTVEFEQGASIGVCDSCGTKQTLPRLDDDKKANLYDRANHFRRNNEFDKAEGIYEQILNEDSTDAEAYWSLVLCRYGIEYVEDPSTHKRIPTVNRAQYTSVFDDEDYKSALQYADGYQKELYEQEAAAINEIQKGILAISGKEEPFDVFICYKETDANGRRTPDSVLATELYHELTREGFKVFFSRITLEDKLGTAYEPYIFAALNSASVMIVLGTRQEYFNAVWVKNEWSRYLALIKNGARKALIPAYKDMDPYDLPEEFSHLQAQDMSRLGFMQDLIRGIKKLVQADEGKETVKETVVVNANANIAPLLKRAFMFLEDGDWDSANEYCEKVLDIDPENAEAYLGKLMAELKVRKQEDLANCKEPFNGNSNYQKALRFADNELSAALKGYITHITERNENARLERIYTDAVNKMNCTNTQGGFEVAAQAFEKISEYKDSAELAKRCMEQADICRKNDIYNTAKMLMNGTNESAFTAAIEQFGEIPGWKDADEQIIICRQKIEEIKEKNREEQIKAEKRKKIRNISTAVVCAMTIIVIILITLIIPLIKYNSAMKLIEKEEYDKAYNILFSLNKFKDSKKYIKQNRIERINYYINSEKPEEAYELYKSNKHDFNYEDNSLAYNMGVCARKINDFHLSYQIFKSIIDYRDSNKLFAESEKDIISISNVGDIVKYGLYEQDNTSSEDEELEWLLLEKSSSQALLITKYCIDERGFNSRNTLGTDKGTWDESEIRYWLNNDFLCSAFNQSEREYVTLNQIKNTGNDEYEGINTQDYVYLLSEDEVKKYFPSNTDRIAKGTKAICYGKEPYEHSWWLRTPRFCFSAMYVNFDGNIDYQKFYSYHTTLSGVRPVISINIK